MPTSPKKKMLTTNGHFEESLNELNQLIEKMETGKLSLEESLSCFETGITLIKHCQKKLNDAEQKIQILTEKSENN